MNIDTRVNYKKDYKKEYKDLYMPKAKPSLIDVPAMSFLMIDGKGNPNIPDGEYQKAVEVLYTLSNTIKWSKNKPEGYFNYIIPPLEGLWWLNDDSHSDFSKKDKYCWISMIRQPEFVTQEVLAWACKEVAVKKPLLDTSLARLVVFEEGLCVQMMHIGPFDDEWKTTEQINGFIEANNLENAISDIQPNGTIRRHHEIYLNDARKVNPLNMKTVLRHPVKYK